MIQRIQSIFLLLGGGTMGALFGLPFATSKPTNDQFLSDGQYNIFDNPLLIVFTSIAILLAIGAIFLYNNRNLQKKLSLFSLIISILLPVLAILLFYKEAEKIGTDLINDGLGLYVPILGVIFLGLAIRFIGKDEKLVKSMDRLR